MNADFSWKTSAKQYEKLYDEMQTNSPDPCKIDNMYLMRRETWQKAADRTKEVRGEGHEDQRLIKRQ